MSLSSTTEDGRIPTKQSEQEWKTNLDPNSLVVLNRHFSTIGIGDVFLEPLPLDSLPHGYLRKQRQVVGGSLTEERFISREIVGSIKSCPQDFIVREIALPGRLIPEMTTEQIEANRIASIPNLITTTSLSNIDNLLPFHQRLSSKEDRQRKSSSSSSSQKVHKVGGDSLPQDQTIDSLENVSPREFLQHVLSLDADKRMKNEDGNKTLLDSIQDLQQSFQEAMMQQEFTTIVERIGTIWIPPLPTLATKQERGQFHRAMRLVFPLLQTESIFSADSSSSSSNDMYDIKVEGNPIFLDLVPFLCLPHVDLPLLYQFYFHGRNLDRAVKVSSRTIQSPVVLRLKPDLERNQRVNIHRIIAEKSHNLFVTNTVHSVPMDPPNNSSTTTGITVSWSKNSKRFAKRKRERMEGDNFPNTLVVVRKSRKDHSKLYDIMVSALRCQRADISFAGKKDFLAVTEQFCTIRSHSPQQILRSAKRMKGIELGEPMKVDWLLHTGDLAGNHFEVVIRNVQRIAVTANANSQITEERIACDNDHMDNCVERIRKYGFINFFGEQRVGVAGDRSSVGVRPFEIGKALLQENFSEAIDLILAGRGSYENDPEEEQIQKARRSWIEQGRNPDITSKLLPHSFSVAKERDLLNGLKRYQGDHKEAFKCIPKEERKFWVSTYQSYLWNLAATERIRLYGSHRAVPGDLIMPRTSSEGPTVFQIDSDEMDISCVVLPLPGTNSVFPTHQVGNFLENLLQQDRIDIRKPSAEAMRGSYRYLTVPVCNLQHQVLPDTTSWKLQFDLPRGSFATMMLRELMSTTVTRD